MVKGLGADHVVLGHRRASGPARRSGRSRRCAGSRSPRTCRRSTASRRSAPADGPVEDRDLRRQQRAALRVLAEAAGSGAHRQGGLLQGHLRAERPGSLEPRLRLRPKREPDGRASARVRRCAMAAAAGRAFRGGPCLHVAASGVAQIEQPSCGGRRHRALGDQARGRRRASASSCGARSSAIRPPAARAAARSSSCTARRWPGRRCSTCRCPGRPESSVMDWFARLGYDTWCLDCEGYGRSDKHRPINCRRVDGADDVAAATEYMSRSGRRAARAALRRLVGRAARGALRAAPSRAREAPRARRVRVDRRGQPDARGAQEAPRRSTARRTAARSTASSSTAFSPAIIPARRT